MKILIKSLKIIPSFVVNTVQEARTQQAFPKKNSVLLLLLKPHYLTLLPTPI
jgi:hypothetical protein